MPELSVSSDGGSITIGGDVTGHDKQTMGAGLTEREVNALITMVGKLQSDMMNVRTELAAVRERINFLVVGLAVFGVLSGIISLVVAMAVRP